MSGSHITSRQVHSSAATAGLHNDTQTPFKLKNLSETKSKTSKEKGNTKVVISDSKPNKY